MIILDFSFYLFVGVVFTGLIWIIDACFFAPKRDEIVKVSTELVEGVEVKHHIKEPMVVEYAKSFFPVLVIVFLLRGFLFEPFRIPSGSMLPSLYIGDFILVNKFSYGIKIPILNYKIVEMDRPARGDVVVFRYPRDTSLDYIKRIIGLPGDHIAYYNKVLYVNGDPVERSFSGQYWGPGQPYANEYQEKFGAMDHSLLLMPGRPSSLEGEYIVPKDSYFVMGDNRDNSNDSRVWGAVPEDHLVGKAILIWMHWSDDLRWNRIGNKID